MRPDVLEEYLRDGGAVLWLLLCLGTVLWALIMLRFRYLLSWSRPNRVQLPLKDAGRSMTVTRRLFSHDEISRRLNWGARWIRTLVVVAPLLGLLGTVSGMVETFSALAGDPDAGASVAGGISEALVTTQFGLILAIPGTLVGRWLDRRASTILELVRAGRPEVP
ncbi:MAG: MotA/TolQ/ExbB proton channel family protein [Myxococcales bacterium]|nr:MotA/TolQ/ExbB proton channel family protein [Myxococcales bacterium]